MSLSLAGGASAATALPTADMPSRDTAPPQITLNEEEIADVSLGTFYVFDKETAGTPRLGEQIARAAVRPGLRRLQGLQRLRQRLQRLRRRVRRVRRVRLQLLCVVGSLPLLLDSSIFFELRGAAKIPTLVFVMRSVGAPFPLEVRGQVLPTRRQVHFGYRVGTAHAVKLAQIANLCRAPLPTLHEVSDLAETALD